MPTVTFHKSPNLDAPKAPVQKEAPKTPMYSMSRKQRRKQEQDLRRRSRKHRPLIDKDYRYQKLTEEQLQQCYDAFLRQAEYAKYNQSSQFIMEWPMTPRIEAYCKENNIAYAQQAKYRWVIVVPAATPQEVFEYKLNKAIEAKVEVICITTQDENIDYIANNEHVEHIVEDLSANGIYAVVLKQEGIIHQNWHDDITFDEIMLIDGFNAKRQRLTIHASDETRSLIETVSNKFETIQDVQVLETAVGETRLFILTVTYKPEETTEVKAPKA